MTFVADECIDKAIVEAIRKSGIKVIYIAEINASIHDKYVLQIANEIAAVLITFDKDFGELVFRQRKINAGVILFRLEGLSKTQKAKLAAKVIKEGLNEFKDAFTVVTEKQIRIRKLKP